MCKLNQNFEPDPAHRLASETDSRGNKTLAYAWSPGGLLNMVQDSDGHCTDYLYDGTGRLVGIWAPNFDYLAFAHDAGGRLTEKWFPNGVTARFTYNPDDSLALLENRSAANSILSSHQYQYDSLGRMTRGPDANWYAADTAFDALGRAVKTPEPSYLHLFVEQKQQKGDSERFHPSVAGGSHSPTTTSCPQTRMVTGGGLAHAREVCR